jgi:two-component system, NarL family, nitrate/nitrite response regulator NarL
MTNDSVFLIDAGRLFREGLRRIFADSPFTVVHESISVEDALPFITSLRPSIVLVDLPDSGEALIERMSQIRAAAPCVRIVVLTETIRVDRLADTLSAGVDGYLLKNMSADALHQSLRLVLLGEKVFPTDLAHLLTNGRIMSHGESGPIGHFNGLSDREIQILGCLLNGAQNKQIAHELKISDGTVKMHLKAILKKIHVRNRTQAAMWALAHGMKQIGSLRHEDSSHFARPHSSPKRFVVSRDDTSASQT